MAQYGNAIACSDETLTDLDFSATAELGPIAAFNASCAEEGGADFKLLLNLTKSGTHNVTLSTDALAAPLATVTVTVAPGDIVPERTQSTLAELSEGTAGTEVRIAVGLYDAFGNAVPCSELPPATLSSVTVLSADAPGLLSASTTTSSCNSSDVVVAFTPAIPTACATSGGSASANLTLVVLETDVMTRAWTVGQGALSATAMASHAAFPTDATAGIAVSVSVTGYGLVPCTLVDTACPVCCRVPVCTRVYCKARAPNQH